MTDYDVTVWLEKQHAWLQEAAIRLQGDKQLSRDDINDLINIITGETKVSPDLSKIAIQTSKPNAVSLLSLENVKGIDRLNPRKPLEFSPDGLSVVYGRNGSGKSGYARILKRVCGKTDEMLKPNIYDSPPAKQNVKIKFNINDDEREVLWDARGPFVPELSSVDVFDGMVGDFYLQKDNEAAYTPQVLTLFTDLVEVCESVAAELEDRKQKLVSKLPVLPTEFSTTQVAQIYSGLDQAKEQQVQEMLSFTEDDSTKLQNLSERLNVDDPTKAAIKLRKTKEQVDNVSDSIKEFYSFIEPTAYENMCKSINNLKEKRRIVEEGAEVLRSSSTLEGVGHAIWKALWEAARTYSEDVAYRGIDYPNVKEHAVCVLCQQELNDDAKQRLQHFEGFVQGKLEKDAKIAEAKLSNAVAKLPDPITKKEWDTTSKAAEISAELSNDIWRFFEQAAAIISRYKESDIGQANSPALRIDNLISSLSELSEQYEQMAIQHEEDAKASDRDKTNHEYLELEAKRWVAGQKDAVKAEIKRIRAIKEYDELKKRTNTRAITNEAGVASKKLVTNAYIERFNNELEKLGASSIKVELAQLRNVKGKGKYRVQLKSAKGEKLGKPAEILSDGEKRIVSLAAFLADVTGKNEKVPFVFDDPISSLDQEFEEATAKRLIELSQDRQVITFTHRLSFLSLVTDNAGDNKTGTICINDEFWGTGEPSDISINEKNPKGALNKLLDEKLAQARKVFEENGKHAYEPLSQAICCEFRIIIERMVELVLMNDIVQRHRSSVQTRGKIDKLALITIEDCNLISTLMGKYSAFVHSQSNESPVALPEPYELMEDIEKAISWHDDFKKRE